MKAQRVYQFVVVFVLILSVKSFAQQQTPLIAQEMPHIPQSFLIFKSETLQKSFSIHYVLPQKTIVTRDPLQIIHPDLYTAQFGFFCRKEWELEKQTYIPFRFRLGSLDYVNKMEGKENHGYVRQ